jgi:hypothetical protein
MNRKGYPADIVTLDDGNNADRSHRGRGAVDYRHWIVPDTEGGDSGGVPVWAAIAIALVLVVGFVVIARR